MTGAYEGILFEVRFILLDKVRGVRVFKIKTRQGPLFRMLFEALQCVQYDNVCLLRILFECYYLNVI